MNPTDSIKKIKGVGKIKSSYLNALNIYTIKDLLEHYPIRYIDKSKISSINERPPNEAFTVKAKVVGITNRKTFSRKAILTLKVVDLTGEYFEVVFFNQNRLVSRFKSDEIYYFYGKYDQGKMVHPEFIHEQSKNRDKFMRITPVYPLTEGLKQWQIRKIIETALGLVDFSKLTTLPEEITQKNKLCPLEYAIKNIHFPENLTIYKIAKYHLIYKEFFDLQLGMILLKNNFDAEEGIAFKKHELIHQFIEKLPFQLTSAQSRVLKEIIDDMIDSKVMNRILQGDVGSGKTIVGFIALYLSVLNGYQGAMMAPTEILANQHYESFLDYFDAYDLKVACLTSSVKNKEKEKIYEKIEDGTLDILIGTHALIQDKVKFKKLGLVITDEQHRFGVKQRQKLAENNETLPDILVMSATPIPRTLSMVLYGDLNISTLDEMPKGRKEISTHFVKKNKKIEMYDFIKKQLLKGRQGYFVCPLVEMSDHLDLTSVEEHFEELDQIAFKDFKVAMIHGQMKNEEKDQIMFDFKNRKIDILVSTTVIEVGIDVPNANFMVIENSERFGLSQLHQLRGRVGRGSHQSYCFLLADRLGKVAKERIRIMVQSNDGFVISKKDLELRGPGEILGIRQSGIPTFKLANMIKHNDILSKTQKDIKDLLLKYKSGKDKEIINFVNSKSKEIFNGYKLS